jgi:dTDP-4-dehydrorhamnose 3,5-epimerase-like enzyme
MKLVSLQRGSAAPRSSQLGILCYIPKQFIHGCHTQKRTVTFVMKHKQHNDPQYADCCSATRAPKNKMAKKMILDQIKRSPKMK